MPTPNDNGLLCIYVANPGHVFDGLLPNGDILVLAEIEHGVESTFSQRVREMVEESAMEKDEVKSLQND